MVVLNPGRAGMLNRGLVSMVGAVPPRQMIVQKPGRPPTRHATMINVPVPRFPAPHPRAQHILSIPRQSYIVQQPQLRLQTNIHTRRCV